MRIEVSREPQATAEVVDRETLGEAGAVEGDLSAAGVASFM